MQIGLTTASTPTRNKAGLVLAMALSRAGDAFRSSPPLRAVRFYRKSSLLHTFEPRLLGGAHEIVPRSPALFGRMRYSRRN